MACLFPDEQIVGVFRGFREGGLEFHADLALPYRNDFQNVPMHGQFVLVQLETPDEAVLGRIASLSSEGKLTSSSGEEFNIRAMRDSRPVPEDLLEQYLRYRVNIRVLGILRNGVDDRLTFIASHRRLPHVGSPVAFPSAEVLRYIAGHDETGAELGHFALGEYVYAAGAQHFQPEPWMQVKSPEVLVRFPIENLVSRRSFIFARAGFGKSNLNKLLFSTLYRDTPTTIKRGGKQVPVGTIIFDPDGEYFWPDDKGRPGLGDVPWLRERLVVFTSRRAPSPFYQSFVAGGIKLDIRRLNPSDVIAIALPSERQEQQNVRKLRGLPTGKWQALVNLVDQHRNQTPLDKIREILDLEQGQQEAEALAARANMTTVVASIHDRRSQLMDMLMHALAEGKLCVIDVSQMRGNQALVLSGLILRRIFDHNQEHFTAAEPKTIPTIAVVEEAQAVLNERSSSAEPYVTWVKEGRKYDLGAVLVTQQPGSIPAEILSQGDNWFIFHLLSSADLINLGRANAHFSEDILSSLLNEPIPGQGVFWSSATRKPYPIPVRVLSFEGAFEVHDPHFRLAAEETYASRLKREFEEQLVQAAHALLAATSGDDGRIGSNGAGSPGRTIETGDGPQLDLQDAADVYVRQAIQRLWQDQALVSRVVTDGVAWGTLKARLRDLLPESLVDRDDVAYHSVRQALEDRFGRQDEGWHAFKNERGTTWVQASPA